jgi:hypothetical protein
MNDNELITVVRESLADVHRTTPVEQIVSRGRAVRARRRISGLAGTLAVTAGAALTVTALLPGSDHAGQQHVAQLAAWTVTKQGDGTIRVEIRELNDAAGLQRKLRADGVPASVTTIPFDRPVITPADTHNPLCRTYPASHALLDRVFPPVSHGPQAGAQLGRVIVIVIHPSALPSGVGVQLAGGFKQLSPTFAKWIIIAPSLVYASPRCTG